MDKPQAVLYLPVQEKQLLLASTNTITKKDHCLVEAPGAGIGQKNTISPTIFFFPFGQKIGRKEPLGLRDGKRL